MEFIDCTSFSTNILPMTESKNIYHRIAEVGRDSVHVCISLILTVQRNLCFLIVRRLGDCYIPQVADRQPGKDYHER